ncbi:DUF4157 domain-containing protein [Paraburkholderia sp. CNPSo 3274]|uniref:eCIS core domain-containing protein n=1 Tax=Paraburkholderia sp. CNPSo 3274 TaxID=2940932 RepID=UPI0020B84172|nr:DUF4157 domain-containing protein [Paraburkholderia sp. CNPSo 3274]MCP3705410.1 DUF4157 domain-containing protein [Paraburkholderia sp. CNPSo 3274]
MGTIQCELVVGAVNDPLEHEADRVAELVMRMPHPALSIGAGPPKIARKCAACAEEEQATALDSVQVRRQADDPAGADEDEEGYKDVDGLTVRREVDASPRASGRRAVSQQAMSMRDATCGQGEPLAPSLRRFFEPRLGHDFSRVRIHADRTAAELNRDLHAKAFAIGQDIYFGEGQSQPHPGKLLAHELVHTLQQNKRVFGGAGPTPVQESAGLVRRQPLDAPDDPIAADVPQVSQAPCPNSVSLGTVSHRNFADQSSADQAKFRTYLSAKATMNVGPGPDHTGHCMKEELTEVSNTCPAAAIALLNSPPCSSSICLDINRFGSGPTAFLDEHKTKGPSSILEGTGKNSCTAICDQIYKCDRTQATTGKFRITRNFKAEDVTGADGSKINVTTGRVEKTALP